MNIPKKLPAPKQAFAIGGHRNLTILVVFIVLFVSICVYFVNAVVLTPGTDDDYQAQAETQAQLINFNTSLLKKAQDFVANTNNTTLPSGRTDPFSP